MYSSYLITFLLLSFSPDSFAQKYNFLDVLDQMEEDAACQKEYDILETEYSALLTEYNAYKTQAEGFGATCLKNINKLKKPNQIKATHCKELKNTIKNQMNNDVNKAVGTAFDTCIYKYKDDVAECRECATLVQRVTKYAGDKNAIDKYFRNYVKIQCDNYHFHGSVLRDPCTRNSARYIK